MVGWVKGTIFVPGTTLVLVCVSMAACGDSGSSSGGPAAASASQVYPISRDPATTSQPKIEGVPKPTAVVGHAYSFKPQVTNSSGAAVTFTIANLPSWTRFDKSNGMLSGTPGATQVGKYSGIRIALVSGKTSTYLPAFNILVTPGNPTNAVTLSWLPPTENSDGTPLVDLKGYKVHYGPASKAYSDTVKLANAGLTTFVVQNLTAGKYYFAVTTYNAKGQESLLSPEVWTMVD